MKRKPYLSIAVAVAVGGLSAHAAPLLIDFTSGRTVEQGNGPATLEDFIEAGLPQSETNGAVLLQFERTAATPGTATDGVNPDVGINVTPNENGAYSNTYFKNSDGSNNFLLNDYLYLSNPDSDRTVEISGLTPYLEPNKNYKLYIWGAGDNVDQGSKFTYGGETKLTPGTNPRPETQLPLPAGEERFVTYVFGVGDTVEDTLEFLWNKRDDAPQYAGLNGIAIVEFAGDVPPVYGLITPAANEAGVWMLPTVQVDVRDGTFPVDAASMKLYQDDVLVANGGTKAGDTTSISYANTTRLDPLSQHSCKVTFDTSDGASHENTWSWTVADRITIPSDYALETPATSPGISIRTFQSAVPGGPADASNVGNAEEQIGGGLVDDFGGWITPKFNMAVPDSGSAPFLNFQIEAVDVGGENFSSTTPPAGTYANTAFLGTGFPLENFTVEYNAYLRLDAGEYRMIVNSDDGFKVSVAPGLGNPQGMLVGGYLNGGKGASDVPMDFVIETTGDYPFRLLYWQGSGNGSLEWIIQDMSTGLKYLINDNGGSGVAAAAGTAMAYQSGSGRATLTKALPADGFEDAYETEPIVIELTDGRTTVASIDSLTLDGAAITPNSSKDGALTIISNAPPSGSWGLGSSHTVELVWTESGNPTPWTNTWSFKVRDFTVDDLPAAPDSFWLEVEDFDFHGGQHVAATDDPSTYTGGGYQQADTTVNDGEPYRPVLNVDYFSTGNGGGDETYRGNPADDPKVALEVKAGDVYNARPGFTFVTLDWNIGWTDAGEWANYTRNIPAGIWNAYVMMAGPNGTIESGLGIVRSGQGTTDQVIQPVGRATAPATGAWQTYKLVQVKAPDGSAGALRVDGSGATTLRFDIRTPGSSGNNSTWICLVKTENVAPSIFSASPADGATGVSRNATLSFGIQEYDRPVNKAGITLDFNGASVTPTVDGPDANGVLTVTYDPGALDVGTTYTYKLSVPDTGTTPASITKTVEGSFEVGLVVSDLPSYPETFTIENEDFDFHGGQHVAAADDPSTYAGGGYQQADTTVNDGEPYRPVLNVDYFSDGNGGGDESYRGNPADAPKVALEVKDRPEDLPRPGGVSITQSWNVGWNGVGEWANYTRNIPEGIYTAAAMIAGPNETMATGLGIVRSGVGTETQVVQPVGKFIAPGTGDWQVYQLAPLVATDGSDAAIRVVGSGATTLRYDQSVPESNGNNNDWFVLIATENVAPAIFSSAPADGDTNASPAGTLTFGIQEYDRPVNKAGITLEFDGASVTPMVDGPDANGVLTVTYEAGALAPGSTHSYLLSVPDSGTDPSSITKTSVGTFVVGTPLEPTLDWQIVDGNLELSWNATGFKLQSQINPLNVGLSDNWVDVPGGDTSPVTLPINSTDPTAFFRLTEQ